MEKTFPIQGQTITNGRPVIQLPASFVSWEIAAEAYAAYAANFGTDQSMERLGERGGFGRMEFGCLLLQAYGFGNHNDVFKLHGNGNAHEILLPLDRERRKA